MFSKENIFFTLFNYPSGNIYYDSICIHLSGLKNKSD